MTKPNQHKIGWAILSKELNDLELQLKESGERIQYDNNLNSRNQRALATKRLQDKIDGLRLTVDYLSN